MTQSPAPNGHPGSPARRPPATLADLAFAQVGYRRAIQEAERATDAVDRRAALAEARRLSARASRLRRTTSTTSSDA